jgi:RNA polymerase sigma-70 factor (ECF subfamily)
MLEYLATMETADDRTRFESLYLAYRGLMYHVAYHILKNPQDAEDAVHQSFVKLAEHMATIPDGPCPRTRNLVVTVAERKAIDLYRSRQRIRRRSWMNRPSGPHRRRAAVWPMPWHPCRPGTGRCFC